MSGRINRRQLVAGVPFAALGLAGAGRQARGASPPLQAELAEDQTLRLVSWALPAYIRPSNEGGPLRMMTENTFMPPFYEDENGELLPGVCTDWSVSEDGLTYTLTMDPRAKFSDGSPVTAADLKFSWEYMCYPDTKSGNAPYVVASVVGYEDAVSGTTTDLAGLVVVDDATLVITLSQAFTPFIKAIATYMAGVVKKDNALTGDDWDRTPVCCGPYKLESWNEDSGELSWVPNEHWWGPPPTIQRVEYRYIQDANTQSIMYDNDEVDVIQPTDILSVQLKTGPHAADLYTIPYGGVYIFAFDTTRAPMDDVNVRRALQKASDMGTIVQAVFQGNQDVAYGLISPNLSAFSNLPPYFDPEGAKAALAASTYGSAENLPPISVRVGTNLTEYVRIAEALQQMWRDVLGVEITISLRAQGEDADDGVSQVFRTSLGTSYLDTSTTVSDLGLSTGPYMTSLVKAKNDDLDAILHQADTLPVTQEEERTRLYRQAEQMLMDQAYYIPIIWVKYYFAVKPWVIGLKSNSSLSLYTLPEMTITEH
jgi:peptide/nickel transport system substrate-binding protein